MHCGFNIFYFNFSPVAQNCIKKMYYSAVKGRHLATKLKQEVRLFAVQTKTKKIEAWILIYFPHCLHF